MIHTRHIGDETSTFAIGEDNALGRQILIRHPEPGRMEATTVDGRTVLAYALYTDSRRNRYDRNACVGPEDTWTVANARDLRDVLYDIKSRDDAVRWLRHAAAIHRIPLTVQAESQ